MGCDTFTEIQRGAPGIPRSLLTQRLALLERQGIIERHPHPSGRGARYAPTEAGRGLAQVCFALGEWGARWLDVAPAHVDPYVALWAMCNNLVVDRLPTRRVVVRFDFPRQPTRASKYWLLIEHQDGEVCVSRPGDEDLVVTAESEAFVRWQAGRLTWAAATARDAIRIDGPRSLARAFPSWNGPDLFAHIKPFRGEALR